MRHRETGYRVSYWIWPKGAVSLLPRAARVVQGGEDQAPVMARWEKVVEVAGDLLVPLDTYPERCRADGFPAAEHLAAMGNELEGEDETPTLRKGHRRRHT